MSDCRLNEMTYEDELYSIYVIRSPTFVTVGTQRDRFALKRSLLFE